MIDDNDPIDPQHAARMAQYATMARMVGDANALDRERYGFAAPEVVATLLTPADITPGMRVREVGYKRDRVGTVIGMIDARILGAPVMAVRLDGTDYDAEWAFTDLARQYGNGFVREAT